MYEEVKSERKGFQSRLYNIRNDTDKMLIEDEEIADR